MKIGIIGNGIVGKSTSILGNTSKNIEILCYDIKSELCRPSGTTMDDMLTCNMIFICVPTPMGFNGKCLIEPITIIIEDLRKKDYKGHVIIRSTVPPGTCRKLRCFHIPNFIILTENTYENDFKTSKDWIIGTNDQLQNNDQFKTDVQRLFSLSMENGDILNDKMNFVSVEESETIKYARNAFLSTKISFLMKLIVIVVD